MTKCVQQLEHCKLYITLREKDLLTEEEAKGMFKLLTGKDSNRYLIQSDCPLASRCRASLVALCQ